jgi:hypothetical protein
MVTKLSKIWIGDPGSEKKPIPDSGSREAPKRHQVQDPDLQDRSKKCTNYKKVNVDECFQKEFKTRMQSHVGKLKQTSY